MKIDTALLTLRPWTRDDIDVLPGLANDRRIWANLRDRVPHPYTRADAEAWLQLCATKVDLHSTFAIEVEGQAAGGIGLELFDDVHRKTAEIGYWLGTAYWGRGLATEAVIAMTRHGFDRLGLERIQAQVFEWNEASMRVLAKAGYTFEGRLRRHVFKDGRLGDALMYARVRGDDSKE
jgi:[ribosomal protein S5]-alanine N-acetyltransferase